MGYWRRRTSPGGTPRARGHAGSSAPDATAWARGLLGRDDWVLLDTETTGLDAGAEIVDLALLDRRGAVILETLLRPRRPIPAIAARVHGLTDAHVRDAPTFPAVWPLLQAALAGRTIVAYNAPFDARLLRQTAGHYGLTLAWAGESCAMRQYAAYRRERPCRLEEACRRHAIPAGGHRAVADCRATLALLRVMAGTGAEC